MKLIFATMLAISVCATAASAQVIEQTKAWLLYDDKNASIDLQKSLPNDQFAKYVESRCKGREKCRVNLLTFSRALKIIPLQKHIRLGAVTGFAEVQCKAFGTTQLSTTRWNYAKTIQLSCTK
jgi:hypothetical protein